jgi:hypothetical protein
MTHTSQIETEWSKYRHALRSTDQSVFDRLLEYAQLHIEPSTVQQPRFVEMSVILSILLEQQLQIDDLENRLDHLKADLNDIG